MALTVHQKPGKNESRLSMAVMAILVIVGAGVIMRQSQINPAVVALRPESRQHSQPARTDKPVLVDTKDAGIAPFSPPERFGPDTLYEKINGRADLYLSAGFVTLATQRFTAHENPGNWMELFVYDMATPANAFSVFSMQRRESAHSDGVAPNAYRTENALFLTHGNFYLEIIGTDSSPELQQAIGLLAQGFLDQHGGATVDRAPGADLFPADDLVPGSLQLIAANAFGFELLDRIYTCEYNLGGTRLTAFVSARPNSNAAAKMADAYRQMLLSYGATVPDNSVPVDDAAVVQFFDTYEIVFSRGPYLAGIHEAGDLDVANMLAKRIAYHLDNVDD